MQELNESEKILKGQKIAEILMLREDKGYSPNRYKTTWGNKTALGIYGTVKRLIEEEKREFKKIKVYINDEKYYLKEGDIIDISDAEFIKINGKDI